MRAPGWFWFAMGAWVVLGLPALVLMQGFRGYFSLLPDPPPILWATNTTDQILGTAIWIVGIPILYMPLFAVPALIFWRRRQSRTINAED